MDRRPGEGRYAHVEREQRWLLEALPPERSHPTDIVDRYLTGTRLRLRRVERDGEVTYKLNQKVRAVAADPEVVKLTSVYLDAGEYEVLAALPAAELHKTRWRVHAATHSRLVVDEHRGPLTGLVLAEVELGEHQPRLPPPPFSVADVTDDDRFSGGALARRRTVPRRVHRA